MSRYRKIDPRFWKDEKVMSLTPEGKLIALYLFTGQSNRIGLFNFSPGEASEDLTLSSETFREGFGKVCKTLNFAWDETFRVLYLPTWWRYNTPANPNVLKSCLEDLHEIPKTSLIAEFSSNLSHLPETFHQTFREGLGEPSPKRMPHQEQEQEQKQDIKGGDLLSSSKAGEHGPKNPGKKGKRKKNPSESISAELQPLVANVISRMNELSGADFKLDSKIVVDGLVARLKNGATEAECLIVVEDRWREWQTTDLRQHFNPETLFRDKNFEKYRNAARIHNNGTDSQSYEWRKETFVNAGRS